METLVDEEEFNELYDGDLDLAWKSFVDNQENGDCQGIVSTIIYEFKTVKKVFGEIEVDEPYIDDYGATVYYVNDWPIIVHLFSPAFILYVSHLLILLGTIHVQ